MTEPESKPATHGAPSEPPTIRSIQAINQARSDRWMADSSGWTILEVAGELCGESGELANVCKKLRRSEMGVPGNKLSDGGLREVARGECGDVMVVLMLVASKLGIDLEDAVRDAFNRKSIEMGFPERIPERCSAPTLRAPEVTDEQLRWLDRDVGDVAISTLREVWPQIRAWLVTARGRTTPKSTPTGQRDGDSDAR